MVLSGHPIHRHEIVLWVRRLQVAGQLNGRHNFIDKIQWSREQAQLVAGSDSEGVGFAKQQQVGFDGWLGVGSQTILVAQGRNQAFAGFGCVRGLLLFNLVGEVFQRRKAVVERS